MGQYHQLFRLDKAEKLDHYTLGAGAKALEQIGNQTMMAGLALACATGFGQHPRDLPWAPKGAWAGKPLASIGDYAENDDLLGHPILGQNDNTQGTTLFIPKSRDIAPKLIPTIERACKIRISNKEWLSTTIGPIDQREDGSWGPVRTDWAATWTDTEWDQHVSYMERVDQKCTYSAPTPLAGAPDRIPSADNVGTGGAGLWISVDAQEYIDTTELGAADLADILRTGAGTCFVQSSLFHHAKRGGDDVCNDHGLHIVGRWRGDRIALVGPKGILINGTLLTHKTIRATYTNVTGLARLAKLLHETAYYEPTHLPVTPLSWHQQAQKIILKAFLPKWSPTVDLNHPFVQNTNLVVYPALHIPLHRQTVFVPASVQLLHKKNSGAIWLPAEVRTQLATAFSNLPPLDGTEHVVVNEPYKTVHTNWPRPTHKRLLDGANAHMLLHAYSTTT